jgi:hypothetical protein
VTAFDHIAARRLDQDRIGHRFTKMLATLAQHLFACHRQGKGFWLMSLVKYLLLFILIVFALPALATIVWWESRDRPDTWRTADWSASGVLASADSDRDAAVYVMAARTGGLKGAISVHSWIVFKKPGAAEYERYDKVGWGMPVRRNAYAPDGRWYSNIPEVIHAVRGEEAERLIPKIEAAIASYPYATRGGYRIWPGPNSNSFVAHVLREVPELGARMPPNAVGRDFMPGWASLDWTPSGDFHATLGGLLGISIGRTAGIEIHFMGLVAGIDFLRPALKVPAFGRVELGW